MIARVTVAWVALSALVFQVFLLAALPHQGPVLAAAAICSHDGASADLPAGPAQPAAHHGWCCILACAGLLPATEGVSADRRAPVALAWRPMEGLGPRAPPVHHTSPRGPPLA